MSNLDNILKEISDDAKERSRQIAGSAKKDSEALRERFRLEKTSIKELWQKKLEAEKKVKKSAFDAQKQQLFADCSLKAKRSAASECEDRAMSEILNMDGYFVFLKELYGRLGKTGEVFLNDADFKRADKDIFKGSKVLKANEPMRGGFILNCRDAVYRCSIESLFEEKHNEIYDILGKIYSGD